MAQVQNLDTSLDFGLNYELIID